MPNQALWHSCDECLYASVRTIQDGRFSTYCFTIVPPQRNVAGELKADSTI